MCKFFSAVSNGNGKVLFFTVEDVVNIMVEGNPNRYSLYSHTSLMHFKGIYGHQEDNYNKWEYDVDKKMLVADQTSINNDSDLVKKQIEEYLFGKDIVFIRNLYGRNSGDQNSGDQNSGDQNSGDQNSGDRNSGDKNSGYGNSGHLNSGHRNSGDQNSGHRNSGDQNSGYGNSGHGNSGHLNSGHRNSGCGNSGHQNSGDQNSGYGNSGIFNSNEPCVRMFNKETNFKYSDIKIPDFVYKLVLTEWIPIKNMSDSEKIKYPNANMMGGYLKKFGYKKAWGNLWANTSNKEKNKIKELPNYDSDVFFEITGIRY